MLFEIKKKRLGLGEIFVYLFCCLLTESGKGERRAWFKVLQEKGPSAKSWKERRGVKIKWETKNSSYS